MSHWIGCTKPSGEKLLVNFDNSFVVDLHSLQNTGHTWIIPIGGGDGVLVKETQEELEAFGLKLMLPIAPMAKNA